MALSQNIKYFGEKPTTIVMQAIANLDGTDQLADPALSPGSYIFPVQVGGGLFNFHEDPIEILQVSFKGGGTLTIRKSIPSPSTDIIVAAILSDTTFTGSIMLSPGESLKFSTSGASGAVIAVSSKLANAFSGM